MSLYRHIFSVLETRIQTFVYLYEFQNQITLGIERRDFLLQRHMGLFLKNVIKAIGWYD